MRIPITGLVFGSALGCAAHVVGPASFQAAYVPQASPSELAMAPPCVHIRDVTAIDRRADTSPVGTRFSEETPDQRYPIEMRGDAAAWVQAGADHYFASAGVTHDPEAQTKVKLVLRSLSLQESAMRLATYQARVVLDVQVMDADKGDLITERTVSGAGTDHGWAGNADAYRDAVNRALEAALSNTLTDSTLQTTFCGNPAEVSLLDATAR